MNHALAEAVKSIKTVTVVVSKKHKKNLTEYQQGFLTFVVATINRVNSKQYGPLILHKTRGLVKGALSVVKHWDSFFVAFMASFKCQLERGFSFIYHY